MPPAPTPSFTAPQIAPTPQNQQRVLLLWMLNDSGFDRHQDIPAESGYTYWICRVGVVNCGYDLVPIQPWDFELMVDGVVYKSDIFAPILTPIHRVALTNGAHLDGHVAFQVPQLGSGPHSMALVLDPGYVSGQFDVVSTHYADNVFSTMSDAQAEQHRQETMGRFLMGTGEFSRHP
jgi:hypothetical protein